VPFELPFPEHRVRHRVYREETGAAVPAGFGGGDYFFVFGEVLKHYEKMHRRYYRFCRYYCVACPEGEVGDVHVSTILCLISRGLFEQLRQEGWEVRTRPEVRWSCVPPDGR
jgi:hypothetical protein